MSAQRPDFYLVGAPKCGTTALFAALGRHPEIFVPRLKEPHYFGEDLHRINARRFTRGEYLALFDEAEEQRVGEASTSYLMSESAPTEIRAFMPDARIIIMLRDPVTVMYAFHAEMVAGGFEPMGDFEVALEAEDDRRAGRRLPQATGGIREALYYRRVVSFAGQVERYLEVFGRSRVRIIFFDDWVGSTRRVFRETLEFLGVDPTIECALTRDNPSRLPRSALLQRFLAEPPRSLRRAARIVPQDTRARLVYAARRLNAKQAPRQPLRPDLQLRLTEELAPEVARLEKVLGRDLSGWRQGRPRSASAGA